MATLTIADLDNGKRDLETVDAVANSRADTTTTRYGDSVLTLAGALRRLGYQAPVPYASGLTIDSGLITVEKDGVVYAPRVEMLPFTTGAWNPDQWRVVQNTDDSNLVYQFESEAEAQAAASTLPEGSSVIVEGETQGRATAGVYVPDSGTPAVRLQDYAELENYSGKASAVDITNPGIAGRFYRRGSAAANGGTVIKDALGRSWGREYEGRVKAAWFGVSVDAPDNKAALQLALNAALEIELPRGRIKLSSGAVMNDYSVLYGAGPSPVYPYDSALTSRVGGTELYLTSAGYALDASGTVGAGINGIAIKSQGGGISAYGAAPAYEPGRFGVDITQSFQFTAKNWSAHGLEAMFSSGEIAAGTEATCFAEFAGWSANDCLRVFDLGLSSATDYATRDIRIADEVLALHCGQFVRAHRPDGLRFENLRLFQATGYSVEVWNAPFVSFSGVTIFESSTSNLLLDGCEYVTGSSMILSRSGGYTATTPWPAASAAIIRNCGTVALQGTVEHPGGRAFSVSDTASFTFNGAVDTAFFTNGSQSSTAPEGAFDLVRTVSSNINATMKGAGCWFSVAADAPSSQGARGAISGDKAMGQVRAWGIQGSAYQFSAEIPQVTMAASGVQVLSTFAVKIPPGKKLVVRDWESFAPVNVTLVIAGKVFTAALIGEPGEGYSSSERYVIADNSAGSSYLPLSFNVSVRNLGAGTLEVPGGYSAYVSLALE